MVRNHLDKEIELQKELIKEFIKPQDVVDVDILNIENQIC